MILWSKGIRRVLRYWPAFLAVSGSLALLIAAGTLQTSRNELEELSRKRLIEAAQTRAKDVALLFENRRRYVNQLADGKTITGYFVNLDLGMSPQYGLNAYLKIIEAELLKAIELGRQGEQPQFKRLVLRTTSRQLLSAVGPPPTSLGEDWSGIGDRIRLNPTTGSIELAAAVKVKNRIRGTLLATWKLEDLSDLWDQTSTDQTFLLFRDGDLLLDLQGRKVDHERLQTQLDRRPMDQPSVRLSQPEASTIADQVSVLVPVPSLPMSILWLRPLSEVPATFATRSEAPILAALAIVILLATVIVARMARRSERLQVINDIARTHRHRLQKKNQELSREVSRRRIVECDLKAKSEQLDRANEDLRIAAAAFESQQGMVVLDMKGTILRANEALSSIIGIAPPKLPGHHLPDLVRTTDGSEASLSDRILAGCFWQGDVEIGVAESQGNKEISRWLTLSPMRDGAEETANLVGTFYDISAQRRAERQVERLAFYDQLTSLPNRPLLTERSTHAMLIAAEHGVFGAILFIDLDHFKRLNDTLGHDMGDKLLAAVAERISASAMTGATVARFGGDEFVVMLPDLQTPDLRQAVFRAEDVVDRVLASFERPFRLESFEHTCTASIGIALFSTPLRSFDDVLKQADIAMYEAKGAGRNAFRFFDPEMQRVVAEEAELENDLRSAIDNNGLSLFFQPQVNSEGEILGAEVLLRWAHPRRGYVSPGDFIPIAEKTGLIQPIGNWVIDQALAHLVEWSRDQDLAATVLSINVSASQLHGDTFVDTLLQAVDRTGADPELLKLEITESLLIRNVEDAIRKMTLLQDRGIRFSLDDFGTGYSSLSYLKLLPLDQLKIDQSFVRDIPVDANDAAIAEMVVALGETLGLNVIAEGVETESQKAFLEDIGCHQFQGFYFARPMCREDFERFVHSRSAQLDLKQGYS